MKMRAVGSFLLITAFSLAAGATAIPLGSSGSSHSDTLAFENLSLDGQMIATQISASGGNFNSDLPVTAKFIFHPVGIGVPVEFDPGFAGIEIFQATGSWVHNPDPQLGARHSPAPIALRVASPTKDWSFDTSVLTGYVRQNRPLSMNPQN